jgi:hypothetical protein
VDVVEGFVAQQLTGYPFSSSDDRRIAASTTDDVAHPCGGGRRQLAIYQNPDASMHAWHNRIPLMMMMMMQGAMTTMMDGMVAILRPHRGRTTRAAAAEERAGEGVAVVHCTASCINKWPRRSCGQDMHCMSEIYVMIYMASAASTSPVCTYGHGYKLGPRTRTGRALFRCALHAPTHPLTHQSDNVRGAVQDRRNQITHRTGR